MYVVLHLKGADVQKLNDDIFKKCAIGWKKNAFLILYS